MARVDVKLGFSVFGFWFSVNAISPWLPCSTPKTENRKPKTVISHAGTMPAHLEWSPTMTLELAAPATLAEELASRIDNRTARVAIVGLGYVGLPLAETFAWGGYPVLGFDIDADKISRLLRGESYIGHICPERIT